MEKVGRNVFDVSLCEDFGTFFLTYPWESRSLSTGRPILQSSAGGAGVPAPVVCEPEPGAV